MPNITTNMTTTSASSSYSPSTKSSHLAEDILGIVRRFGQLKVVRHEDTHHVFENFFPMGPTYCTLCPAVIIILRDKQCRDCKLVACHKCIACLKFKCVKNTPCPPAKHLFTSISMLKTPTFCKHCTGLIGVTSAKRCIGDGCGMIIHSDCEKNICRPCHTIKDTTRSHVRVSMKDFDLIDELGTGSFSSVYLARMRGNGRKFALKVVEKTNPTISGDPESVLTELRVLQFGKHHPFLTGIQCCFQTSKRLYFVMDFVDGDSLGRILYSNEVGKFSDYQTMYYSAEIALAVEFLHSKGVVHRDLKLENVIIGRDGHCKLTDFGLSKFLDQTEDMKTRTFCGTPHCMCPEMIDGFAYSFPCDWWAFGVLMFELLLRYPPFCSSDADNVEEIYRMIQDADLDIPNHLSSEARSMLQGLLTKDPERRFKWQDVELHPFFEFKNRDGSREHQWLALEQKQIKPPSMPIIKKSKTTLNNKVIQKIIDDINTEFAPSGPFSEFNYCDESFEKLLPESSLSAESFKPQ